MKAINLLPWRELKRIKQRKKYRDMLMMSIILIISGIILFHYYLSGFIERELYKKQRLDQEIRLLNAQIKNIQHMRETLATLVSRIQVIKNLQLSQAMVVRIFGELVSMMPEDVSIKKIVCNYEKIIIYGYAPSTSAISLFIQNMNKNPFFKKAALDEIKKSSKLDTKGNAFKLHFILPHA